MAVEALYDFEEVEPLPTTTTIVEGTATGIEEPYGITNPITYRFYDSLFGQWFLTLPLTGVTFGGGPINSAGSMSGKLAISDPTIQGVDWIKATTPTLMTLIIDKYDSVADTHQILWGGLVTGRKEAWDSSGVSLEIDAQEGLSWLNHVIQATDYSAPPYSGITGINTPMSIWNGRNGTVDVNDKVAGTVIAEPYIWDPMLMMAQILHDAFYTIPFQNLYNDFEIALNGRTYGDYIAAATGASGITDVENYVSITFPYTSLQTLSSIMQQYNGLGFGVGFDSTVVYNYDGPSDDKRASIHATIQMSYPIQNQGATGSSGSGGLTPTGVVIDLGGVHGWQWPEDGTTQATTVYETGGNQDIVVVQNVYAVGAGTGASGTTISGYPNSSRVFNIANLNSPNPTQLLRHMGNSDLTIYSWPPATPVITVDLFDEVAGIGKWMVGDIVGIHIPNIGPYYPGYPGATGASGTYDFDEVVDVLFDPRFPSGFDDIWRIISYEATVADQGGSTVDITFDLPPNSSDAPITGIFGASGASGG